MVKDIFYTIVFILNIHSILSGDAETVKDVNIIFNGINYFGSANICGAFYSAYTETTYFTAVDFGYRHERIRKSCHTQ